MYKFKKPLKTTLKVNKAYIGETIEQKVERIINNNEPLTDGAEITYQTREEGRNPKYDIRTDRWDLAIEASDHITKTELTKRQERIQARKDKKDAEKNNKGKTGDGGAEPVQGTKE